MPPNESSPARRFLLLVLGALVAISLVAFWVYAARDTSAPVDERALAKAKADYIRSQSKPTPPVMSDPIPTPTQTVVPKKITRPEAQTPSSGDSVFSAPRPMATDSAETESGEKSDMQRMNDANAFYDKQNFEEAQEVALELLDKNPKNVRMLRVMVSSACIMGEEADAKRYYANLPPRDQRQMAARCVRYGIEL